MIRSQPVSVFDRIVAWSLGLQLSRTTQYLLATLVILAVGGGRVLFVPDTLPWLLFIPATIAIALITGKGPGLFAAGLSTATGIASLGTFAHPTWVPRQQWIAAGLFLLVMIGLVILTAELRGSLRRARRLNAELVESERRAVERQAFLSGVLASSTDCITVLDLDGRLTFMSDGGQRVMEVGDFNAVAGCPWPDFWQGDGRAEAEAAIEAARRGAARSFVGKANTYRGTPRWWHVAVSPIAGPDGRPDRILAVSRDITNLRASEEDRDRFVRLAENSTDFIGMARTDGSVFYLNDAARRLVGLDGADLAPLTIADFFPPDQVGTVTRTVLPAVARDGHWAGALDFRHFGTGELIPVLYSVFPITDASGALIGYATVTRDFRDRRRAEDDMRLMNDELAHRLKNVLAVVQSVAAQTLRGIPEAEAASRSLSARLVALGAATDVLTGRSWRSADLCELATRALSPHGRIGERIRLSGPAVTLKPELTVAFALALHELATNAAKYGALSNDTGHVALTWSIDGEGDDATLSVCWREAGGPPVTPPLRKGFGSVLIERSLRSYFSGKAATDYRPDGLVFELAARLGDAAIVTGN
ncbi:PAS domain-containing protein [Sphingomonas sp. CV7422]|uniref:PAS domain-containing protein n=1 Tax=Sphingomonas sp. CV7422 TaxID=3018036 RepID=UPI0022FF0050|nr:PAS domain-containing protein [Sphingomonas sp. CV7422]